ncbi:CCA tRNA nucleotidyltransferase, mitochondrial [Mortierella sp. AD031]|nr:CCA tRNA nucleotidyltransferase, mitochondrial [Mortierella sp. AD031]
MRAVLGRLTFVCPLNLPTTTAVVINSRPLIQRDFRCRTTTFHAPSFLSATPFSRSLTSSTSQCRQGQVHLFTDQLTRTRSRLSLYQLRTLNQAHSRTFILEGRTTLSTPSTGAAQQRSATSMTASTSTSNCSFATSAPKRRASLDLLPVGQEHASKQRIVPVSYGTSIFFNRSLSTSATAHSQHNLSKGDLEASSSQLTSTGSTAESTVKESEPRAMVAKNYEAKERKKVELRIAGGWVRDKLLGLSCHDLDVGLDKMMGYEFAVLVNEYMELLGEKKRTIAKIATNPEKSKHLETATMVVLGMPLDFVNLRSEVYDDSSRIPSEITFGTPKEDAERRDITINALFYNIHTHEVEDCTGLGLQDLRNGIIRTPLEAYETFWQDPLRVMRCIRFAARFQFGIAEDAKQAILDSRIKQALKTKISKERIGSELDKMIEDGAGRSTAIRLLQELGLYDVVFAPPEVNTVAKGTTVVEGTVCEIQDAFKLVWIMEWILKIHPSLAAEDEADGTIYQAERDAGQESLLRQTQSVPMTSHLSPLITSEPIPGIPHILTTEEPYPERLAKRNLILAAMLYPYREMTATVNKKIMPAGSWILRYGLKGRNVDIEIVTKLMESLKAVQETVSSITAEIPESQEVLKKERAKMGMLIRDIGFITVVGKKWRSAFLLGLGVDLLDKFDLLKQGILDDVTKAKVSKYNAFLSKAETYQIDHCFSWKYIVDGKEITRLLKVKPGPKVTGYLQTIMRWQLQHPHSSKEECQAWIQEHPKQFQ